MDAVSTGTSQKKDAASPSAALESVVLISVIDAKGGRDVGIGDVQGSFLHANNDKDTWMLLTGTLAKLMVKVDPEIYS